LSKIYFYELRRLLYNKLFFGILLVSLGFGWLTLTGALILGIAHTAPFSPWSFGYYLSRILPLICLGEVCFLAFFSSREERLAASLTRAAPVKQQRYLLLRLGAVLTAVAFLCLGVSVLAVLFYRALFGRMNLGELLWPGLLALVPPVIFCLGAGLALSRIRPVLLYPFMAVVVLLTALPLPSEMSLSMSSFYSEYPLTLEALEPAFQVPLGILVSRAVFFLLGLGFFLHF
jgi:hypothetical protein